MGNPHHPRASVARLALPKVAFEPLDPDISIYDQGFYHGFPCHLGHTIRHQEDHWCYECVRRIQSNVVGLDVNFITENYRREVINFWSMSQFETQVNAGRLNALVVTTTLLIVVIAVETNLK